MPNPKVKNMPRKQQMAVKASMAEQSPAKMKGKKKLKKVVKQLKGASKMHAGQAKTVEGILKQSPMLKKLSASCKAAARRKFKVYPSAYANMWASKTQKAGKC